MADFEASIMEEDAVADLDNLQTAIVETSTEEHQASPLSCPQCNKKYKRKWAFVKHTASCARPAMKGSTKEPAKKAHQNQLESGK